MATITTPIYKDRAERETNYLRRNASDIALSLSEEAWEGISNLIETITHIKIDDYPDFNTRNYGYMLRLLSLGAYDKDVTLSMISNGTDVVPNGESDNFSHQAQEPSYVKAFGLDYLDYARDTKIAEQNGENATRMSVRWEPQRGTVKEIENLYPEEGGVAELNRDTEDENARSLGNRVGRWDVDDPRSLLYKTQQLLRQNKIHSLIGRFGTNTNGGGIKGSNDADTAFGESRGRNLLTKKAEKYGEYDNVNGYNNPYCRVWTYHHQYDTYNKLMRPFSGMDTKDGESPLVKIHSWANFEAPETEDGSDNNNAILTWKDKGADRWKKSVLNTPTGMPNIVPKYKGGGGEERTYQGRDVLHRKPRVEGLRPILFRESPLMGAARTSRRTHHVVRPLWAYI